MWPTFPNQQCQLVSLERHTGFEPILLVWKTSVLTVKH